MWMFGRRHYIYVWLSLFCIWFYAIITGFQAPVVRAVIMASIFLFAELAGRQKQAFPALTLSAAIMVAFDPELLWNISFQLSYLAMIGLIFLTPLFQELGQRTILNHFAGNHLLSRVTPLVTDSFSVTFGAIIAVLPVLAFNFHSVSLIGPLATLLAAPALTPIIVLGILTAFAGLISPVFSQVIGWTCWLFLSYMLWLINTLSGIPWASLTVGSISPILVWSYYAVLFSIIWALYAPIEIG